MMDRNDNRSPMAVNPWPTAADNMNNFTPTKARRSWFSGTPHKATPNALMNDRDEDLPLLKLTHFTKKVMVCFDKVRTGTTRTRELLVENPCDFPQELRLEKFPANKGFSVPEKSWELDGQELMRLPITWTPMEEGNARELVTFKCEGAFRLQVILLGTAEDPPRKRVTGANRRSTFSVHRKAPLKETQPKAVLKPSRPTMILKAKAKVSQKPKQPLKSTTGKASKENRNSRKSASRPTIPIEVADEPQIVLSTPSPMSACGESLGEEFTALDSSLAEINGSGMPVTAEDLLLENVKRQTLSVCNGMSPLLQTAKPFVFPKPTLPEEQFMEEIENGNNVDNDDGSGKNEKDDPCGSPKRLSIEAKTTVTKNKAPEVEPSVAVSVRKNLFSNADDESIFTQVISPQEFEDSLNIPWKDAPVFQQQDEEDEPSVSPKRLSVEEKTTVTKNKAPEVEKPSMAVNIRKNLFSNAEDESISAQINSPQEFEDSLNVPWKGSFPHQGEDDEAFSSVPDEPCTDETSLQGENHSEQYVDANPGTTAGEHSLPGDNDNQSDVALATTLDSMTTSSSFPAPACDSSNQLDADAFPVHTSVVTSHLISRKRLSDPKEESGSPPKRSRTQEVRGQRAEKQQPPPRDRTMNRTLALRKQAALRKSGAAAAAKSKVQGKPTKQYKAKGPMKGVPMAKLNLLQKNTKSAIPRHPMPFAAKNMFYDERWMEKQERGFTRWLNHVLTPDDCPKDPSCKATKIDAGTLCVEPASSGKATIALAPSKEDLSLRAYTAKRKLNRLRRGACMLFQSEPIVRVIQKLEAEIEKRRIVVRVDRKLHADYGIKQKLLDLFLSYNPLWLRIGLETTYGEILPIQSNTDVVGLSRFVITRLLGNPDIAAQYAHPTVPHLYGPGYEEALSQFTLKKFLVLVFFLDRAKLTRLIDHDPCLFCKDSEFKSSRDILLHFSREYLRGEGDLTRHLSFMGYNVTHRQTALDEFDFSVTKLASDLRCGVRLARVVELLIHDWTLSSQLRMPAISRLQKIHNVEITLKAMKLDGGGVDARAIVDGHREKTLELLWRIIFQFQIGLLLNEQQIKDEIAFLRKNLRLQKRLDAFSTLSLTDTLGTVAVDDRRDSSGPEVYFKSGRLSLLLKWCQAVCSFYDLKVENFTVAFSDGRALCCLVHHYHPSLLPLGLIHQSTTQTQYQAQSSNLLDGAQDDSFDGTWSNVYSPSTGKPGEHDKLLANERENFKVLYDKVSELGGVPGVVKSAEMSNTIPDEKVVITYVSYLCARLLDLRKETRAARTIQMVWKAYRLRQLHKHRQAQQAAAQTIQHAVRHFLTRRRHQRLLGSIIRLQAMRRQVLASRKVQQLRQARLEQRRHQAATSIQAHVKGFLARQYYQKTLKAIVIQSALRGFITRRAYLETRQAVITLQAAVRCYQVRQSFAQMREAVVVLQRRFRANCISREQRAAYTLQRNACITLQAALRGYMCRQLYQKQRAAAVVLQATIRAHQQRKQYLEVKSAALKIQEYWRSALLARTIREEYLRLQKAAVTVQSFYRGMVARRQALYIHNVIKAQSVVRCFIQRKKYLLQKRASIVIQKRFRGYTARVSYKAMVAATLIFQQRFRALRDGRRQLIEYNIKRGAIITLQAWTRGILVRKMLAKQVQSAVCIQAAWKMHAERMHYLAVRSATQCLQKYARAYLIGKSIRSDFLELKTAAVLIQSHYRAVMARRRFLHLKASCITVQSAFRMHYARKQYVAIQRAAIVLQRRFRAKTSGDRQLEAYNLQRNATVFLQAWFRGLLVRQQIAKQHAAALQIQAAYKAYKHQRSYTMLRSATVCLQKYIKAYLIGRTTRCEYLKQKSSAIVIQASYRSLRARRSFLHQKRAAVKIQSFVRMQQAQHHYATLKQAAIVIQTRYCALRLAQDVFFKYQICRGACITLQAGVRGFLVRRQMRKLHQAAVLIQTSYRSFSAHSRYHKLRNAAVILQTHWRATRETRDVRQDYLSLKNAAVVLQSAFRGKLGRRVALEHLSARIIQSFVRMHLARQQYQEMKQATVMIQSALRMHQARSRFTDLRQATVIIQTRYRAQRLAQAMRLQYQLARGACITLQAGLRGFLVRQQMRRLHDAAVKIQKSYRAHSARSNYEKLRNAAVVLQTRWRATRMQREIQQEFAALKRAAVILQSAFRGKLGRSIASEHRSARIIQSYYRMHVVRNQFQVKRQAVIKIQSAVRMHQANLKFTELRRAAVIIQTRYRAKRMAQAVCIQYQIHRGACITIQAGIRGFLVRQQMRNLNDAAVKIQKSYRSHSARSNYQKLRNAAVVLQTRWRATRLQREVQQEFAALKRAAVILQSAYRGKLGRLIALEHRSARVIQSFYRMHVVQNQFQVKRQAVIKIQSAVRMHQANLRFTELRRAAVIIQTRYHAKRMAKAVCLQYQIHRGACITIQAGIRGFLVRQQMRNLHDAAVKIQKSYRSHSARSKYQKLRNAAVVLQKRWRATRLQSEIQQEFAALKRAAVVLQSAFRGKLGRSIASEHRSARIIQSYYRMHVVRNQFQEKRQAVIKIQSAVRMHQANLRFTELKQAAVIIQTRYRAKRMAQAVCLQYQIHRGACITIQAGIRGFLVRQQMRNLHNAAVKIQKSYRSHSAHSKYQKMRNATVVLQTHWRATRLQSEIQQEFAALKRAAVVLQSAYRGKLGRYIALEHRSARVIQSYFRLFVMQRQFQTQKRAAVKIQSALRMHQAHSRFTELRQAAIVIQTRYRAAKLGEETCIQYHVRRGACITVQAYVRGFLVRQHIHRLHAAATDIQKNYRAHRAQKQFLKLKEAAGVLQKYWRACRMARKQRDEYTSLKAAAVIMQSLYRGRVGRQVAKEHCAARLIQSVYRMHVSAKEYRRLREAAITIQSFCRMHKARQHFTKLVSSAVTVQQFYRGHLATKATRNNFLVKRSSAITIQAAYRGFVQRRLYVALKEAATKVQALYRGKRQQEAYQSTKRAAMVFQRRYRAHVLRNQAVRVYSIQRGAAITIQAAFKGYTARRRYIRISQAVTTIQASYRGHKQRTEFLSMKKAAAILQTRYRAHLLTREAIQDYQRLRKSAITIQSMYRAYRARQYFITIKSAATVIQAFLRGTRQRDAYREIRRAATILQKRYRAHLLQRDATRAYHIKRGAAITIQAYYRGSRSRQLVKQIRAATKIQSCTRMLTQRRKYQALRNAANKIRANFKARQARRAFLRLKQSTLVLQTRYRALKMAQDQERKYHVVRGAAITIQSFLRGHQARSLVKRIRAATTIQSAFRAYVQQRHYQRVKKSTLLLQSLTRGTIARREFTMMRRNWQAAVCIQRHYRDYVVRRTLEAQRQARLAELERFSTVMRFHLSVIRIQRCYRLYKMRQAARAKMQSIVTIQVWMRAKLQRLHFLKLRRGMVALQHRVRQHQAHRHHAAVCIQALARGWLARQYVKKMEAAALTIQSIWRGRKLRRSCKDKKVAAVRARCIKANKAATEEKKLCNRTTSALDYLLQYRQMSGLLEALISLDVVSRLSATCCLRLVEGGAVPVIFTLIKSCNRSLPCMEVIKYSVNILLNLAKYPPTAHAVFEEPESAGVILDLMQMYREKGARIFAKVCMLMGTLCQDPRRAQILLSVSKNKERLLGINRLTERKFSMDAKRALVKSRGDLSSSSLSMSRSFLNVSSVMSTPRPAQRRVQPDWVLGRGKTKERTDPLEACHFVMEVLKLK